MKSYDQFILESKIIYDSVQPFEEDVNWNFELDVNPLWQKFQQGQINQLEFNKNYATMLTENKDNLGEGWIELEPLVNRLSNISDPEESTTIYNKIYDIADKNLIKINITE